MQPSHASFVPDLDLNPPVGWSEPASALGLSNPLKHLPQSQQVQRLQQQIQQHRQLQQSALQGHDKSRKGSGTGSRLSSKSPSHSQSLFDRNPTSSVSVRTEDRSSKAGSNTNRHSMHFGATASDFGYVQHINIQNHDEDSNMSGDDHDEDGDDGGNCTDSSANSIRGGMDIKTGPGYSNQSYHYYRSPTNTAHFSRGFTALHGFTPIISPGSNSSPPKYHGRQTRQVPIVTNVVKEVVTPTRRMAHILSEQKRREKINGGFDELKSVIPECADNTDSKASILRKAVDYICLLEEEIRKYVEVYEPDHGGDFGDQRRSED
ncbi:hypothetical protein KVV02_002099 [Mortierella alpina]|uniref:BHLH domain-containing protein n=1 Tax=Mortierella alpina TaxID=64518 RepID=A0A9P8CVT7_MORAP|nr:hypothetical protein KVV02_002099 [Mortierella alpina]